MRKQKDMGESMNVRIGAGPREKRASAWCNTAALLSRLTFASGVLLIALLCFPPDASAGKSCYTIALPAISSPLRTAPQWEPFIKALSERSGVCLQPRVSSDLSQFDARLSLGEAAFAMPPPSSLIDADSSAAYIPLVTSGTQRIRGVLVVRADSGVMRPADLRAADVVQVGVASPTARFMSVEPQRALRRAGVDCRAVDFGDPSNVLRAVALGRVPVGAAIDLVLGHSDPVISRELRVIFSTKPHLKWPIAAHRRVEPAVREAVARAVLGMNADDAGRALLQRVHLDDPVRIDRAAYVADLADAPSPTEGCSARPGPPR